MAQAYRIDFQTGSVANLAAELRRAAQDARTLNAALTGVVAQVSALNQAAAGATGGGGSINVFNFGGGGGGGGAGRSSTSGMLSGPYQRLRAAQANFQKALARGINDEINDASLALKKAEDAVARAQRPDDPLGNALRQFIGSTRIGFGRGGASVMPLISGFGRVAGAAAKSAGIDTGALAGSAVGMAGAGFLAGFIASAALAAAALNSFVDAVKSAAETLTAFGGAALATGGTPAQVAALRSMGLGPGEIKGLSGAVQAATSTPGFGMMAAQGVGLGFNMPSPFGNPNEGGRASQFMKGLQEQFNQSPTAALQTVRMMGIDPSILQKLNVSGDIQAGRQRDASLFAGVSNPVAERRGNDLSAAMERVSGAWETLITAFGTAGFDPITKGLMHLADALNGLSQWFTENPMLAYELGTLVEMFLDSLAWLVKQLPALLDSLQHGLADRLALIMDVIFWFSNKFAGPNNQQPTDITGDQLLAGINAGIAAGNAIKQFTDPALSHLSQINQNTGAIAGYFKQGTYGGGDRARGAIPSALTGYYFSMGMVGTSLRLGAFTV